MYSITIPAGQLTYLPTDFDQDPELWVIDKGGTVHREWVRSPETPSEGQIWATVILPDELALCEFRILWNLE